MNNPDCRQFAHRFIGGYRSKAREPIAAPATNLAVCRVFLDRTLVGIGRTLVVRTQTLVCAQRLNSLGSSLFTLRPLSSESTGFRFERKHGCRCQTSHDERVTSRPFGLADPGLVLVRRPDHSGFQDERRVWIMSVKSTDTQFVMLSSVAQREDHCLTVTDKMKGAIFKKSAKSL
jgi:hypothetical protein